MSVAVGDLAFAPLLPAGFAICVATLALLAALYSAIKTPRSGVLRILSALALAGFIANPQVRFSETTPLDDIAVVIIDASASQSLGGRSAIAAAAEAELDRRLAGMPGLEVVKTRIGSDEESPIGEAISRAYADNPGARLGAVFVLTDGAATDEIVAPRKGAAPLHAIVTGADDERDRKVSLIDAPRYGVVNEGVEIAFRIDDVGRDNSALPLKAQPLLTLRVNGEQVLRERVPTGTRVAFTAPLPRPGKTIVELEVEPLEGELTARNNIAVLDIAAIRDRLRVLLVSGEPHAGERTWRNLLKSDPAIDLIHFTILRPTEKAQSDTALEHELSLIEFPVDELFIEKLSDFDLVIFDRYTYRGVLNAYHFDNLARFVENGGGVLVAAGPEFSGYLSIAARRNFAYILPAVPAGDAIETPFRAAVTKAGERHPVTSGLPDQKIWGRWLRVIPSTARAGDTLLSGADDQPLLILDHVGKGRVGMIMSDHVWLWARGFDGGGPHAELLRRVAHWLMKEPDLEEENLTLADDRGSLVVERRSLEDAPGPVSLEGPDGKKRDVAVVAASPGLFRARIDNAARGVWRARAGDLFALGAVGVASPPEYEDVVSRPGALTPLVRATGGGVFLLGAKPGEGVPQLRRLSGGARGKAGPQWAGIIARNAQRVDSTRDKPLAPPFAYLAALALTLLGAWLVESGRFGRKS
jgi:hypothetical protein